VVSQPASDDDWYSTKTHVGRSVEHSTEEKDGKDSLFLEHRPVQRVIRILARLRREHDMRILSNAMFEAVMCVFGLCCAVIE